jgi:hypothetical protein
MKTSEEILAEIRRCHAEILKTSSWTTRLKWRWETLSWDEKYYLVVAVLVSLTIFFVYGIKGLLIGVVLLAGIFVAAFLYIVLPIVFLNAIFTGIGESIGAGIVKKIKSQDKT